MYEYKAEMRKIVDGDTVDFLVDLGFTVKVDIRMRLANIDTPEVYGVKHSSEEYAEGKKASEFARLWFEENCPEGLALLRSQKPAQGKYGRWIVEVFALDGEGTSLNVALVESGNAEYVDY
jgi:micrococcal nuclease